MQHICQIYVSNISILLYPILSYVHLKLLITMTTLFDITVAVRLLLATVSNITAVYFQPW